MDVPNSAAEMRSLVLQQYPWAAGLLAQYSDTEILSMMVSGMRAVIAIKKAELAVMRGQLEDIDRALSSQNPH